MEDFLFITTCIGAAAAILMALFGVGRPTPFMSVMGVLLAVACTSLAVWSDAHYSGQMEDQQTARFAAVGIHDPEVDGDSVQFAVNGGTCVSDFIILDDTPWLVGPTLICTPGLDTDGLPILSAVGD